MRLSISQVRVRGVHAGAVSREALRPVQPVQRSSLSAACKLRNLVTVILISMMLHSTSAAALSQTDTQISAPAPLAKSTGPISRPARNVAPRKPALPQTDAQ